MDRNGAFSGSTVFCMDGAPPILLADKIRLADDHATALTDGYVLILSREEDTRFLLATMLELWGFRAEVSHNLEHSLSSAGHQPPSLMLLDSVFPFAANLEAIRRIRADESLSRTPLALISGFSTLECRSLSLAGGADDFFPKPIDFERLKRFLAQNLQVPRLTAH